MKNIQGKLPILLSILFVSSISLASFFRLQLIKTTDLLLPTLLFIFLYLVWLIIESKIAKKELSQNETNIDYWSLEIYAFSRALVVLSGLIIPSKEGIITPIQGFGLLLFVLAVIFRLFAIKKLGQFYSHRVRVQTGHQIIQTGPYQYLRHPAYTGMIFSHLGFSLFFLNPWTLSLWAFFHVPAVIYRIIVEEKTLMKIPGYTEYSVSRKRIVPFLW